ncbi:MAG TPA: hypothetical protein VF596_11775 [Pyrinomonadaceae bacterium]
MRKPFLLTLHTASIICALLAVLWLIFLVVFIIIIDGGTYTSRELREDGSFAIVHNVPLFTADNWTWVAFQLFGIPVLVLIAAIQTIRALRK